MKSYSSLVSYLCNFWGYKNWTWFWYCRFISIKLIIQMFSCNSLSIFVVQFEPRLSNNKMVFLKPVILDQSCRKVLLPVFHLELFQTKWLILKSFLTFSFNLFSTLTFNVNPFGTCNSKILGFTLMITFTYNN